ncbi:CLUMA_CG019720, isoform A [Clunio marinus]|uniref:CLUMA_CG019720, isoform A n=1 Tax=Clunio marinus TaxID=568069 RepID=A0A1J1J7Q3_9DIPT|nr:CLUMA_CG019720, isoform A [Clunio marinus]
MTVVVENCELFLDKCFLSMSTMIEKNMLKTEFKVLNAIIGMKNEAYLNVNLKSMKYARYFKKQTENMRRFEELHCLTIMLEI